MIVDESLPVSTVKVARGEFTVHSSTVDIDDRPRNERDYAYAVTLTVGPCSVWLSADEALALAEALTRHAHHFIAFATETKLENAA